MGYNKEESDLLLNFLYSHIASSQDCQVRVRWSEGAVVVFDVRARNDDPCPWLALCLSTYRIGLCAIQ